MTRTGKLKGTAAALVVTADILRRAIFSGIPSNARLRRHLNSAQVRHRRDEARDRLLSRLDEVEAMFPLQRIGLQVVDKALRPDRLSFLPEPQREAMSCSLHMTCYFVSQVDPAALIREIVENVGIGNLRGKPRYGPNRSLSLVEAVHLDTMEEVCEAPDRVRPGPVSLTVGAATVYDSVDWDVPGQRSIVDHYEEQWQRRNRPNVIRFTLSWSPEQSEVQLIREQHATVIAWTVWTEYYDRPKGQF